MENCIAYLALAFRYKEESLQKATMALMGKNFKSLMLTPKWEELGMENPDIKMEVMEALLKTMAMK